MSVFHCNDCNFAVEVKKWFGPIFTDFKIDMDFTFAVDVTQRENPQTVQKFLEIWRCLFCRKVPLEKL